MIQPDRLDTSILIDIARLIVLVPVDGLNALVPDRLKVFEQTKCKYS